MVATWLVRRAVRCCDVTTATPHAIRVNNPWSRPRIAAQTAEKRAEARSDNEVRALSFDVYGPTSRQSIAMLTEAAREACLFGRTDANAYALIQRWRAQTGNSPRLMRKRMRCLLPVWGLSACSWPAMLSCGTHGQDQHSCCWLVA